LASAASREGPPSFEEIIRDIGVVLVVHLSIALAANLLVIALGGA
jgi:hypothetical protein